MSDKNLKEELRRGVEYTYNYDFAKAKEIYKIFVEIRPNHPVTPMYYAMMVNWEDYPLLNTSPKSNLFVDSLLKSISICEKMLKKNEEDVEGIFFNLVARLMLMQYYADNNISMKVISHVSPAYKMLQKGFTYEEKITDFYYSTGLYNYYREAYPEQYPIYKSIAVFFPKGDKKLGLQQLDYAGSESTFLGAEALSFLYYIYMYYENNYDIALRYAELLNTRYPNNPLYLSNRIQLLLLLKQYEHAEELLTILSRYTEKNKYFQMLYLIYRGIVEEKKNNAFKSSKNLYYSAISVSYGYSNVANDQLAFAYFGLSRLLNLEGNRKTAKEYRKTAESMSSFPNVNFD